MGGVIFIVAVCALGFVYVRTIARSRRQMDSLHEPPDDMKRAGDQPPPYDGSSGWV